MRPPLKDLRPVVPVSEEWTNRYGMSEAAANAIKACFSYDFDPTPTKISVTELIDPPRLAILRRRHGAKVVRDVSEYIAPFLGTCVHREIERQAPDGTFTEERLEAAIGGFRGVEWMLRGKADLVEVDAKGKKVTIRDIKVSNVWKAILEGFDDWFAQLNLYAYLWRWAGFEVDKLYIEMFLTGWRRSEWRRDPKRYPKTAYRLVPVPVWSEGKTIAYLVSSMEVFADQYDQPDDALIVCPSDQRWIQKGKWALMKRGRKSAVKNEHDKRELERYVLDKKLGTKGHDGLSLKAGYSIEGRPGEETRCVSAHPRYCPVREMCSYAMERGYLELEKGVTDGESPKQTG